MAGIAVVGRDEEFDSICTFVAEVELGPRALVLAGEAGIGKTILWKAGVEAAERRIGQVLTCRGVEAEAALSFAGLSDLLAPVLEEAVPSLVTPRRRALETALLLVEPGEVAPDVHAIGLAVLDVLNVLSLRGPLVIAVDDVQWLDPASAAVLQIALRRLDEEPIGFLGTFREAPGLSVPIDLELCFAVERCRRLEVGPLGLGGLYRLLRERLGLDLSRPELVNVQDATAGNPFFALELGRELVRTNTRPTAGQPLLVPNSLGKLLGERLGRLPTDVGDVLLKVAALARPTVDVVVAADGDRHRVLDALDVAAREGVVEVDHTQVHFTHPLYSSLCYQQAPPRKRRAVHQALAGAVTDLEERARHLALATEGTDAGVASELDAAADIAAARGATAAAAELCELAAVTSVDRGLARKRLLRAAILHRLAGDRERPAEMLEQVLAESPSGVERADVLFELARTRRADSPTLIALCDQALTEAGDDEVRCARLLTYRSLACFFAGDISRALLDARAALEKAERIGDPTLLAVAIARVGQAETYAADVTPGLLERGADIEERLGLAFEYSESARVALARLRMRLGDVDGARTIFEDFIAKAVARGDESSRGSGLWSLGIVEWLAGHWETALAHTADAYEVMGQSHDMKAGMVGRFTALIEADLGLVDQARRSAEYGLAAAQEMSDEFFAISSIGVLGRLELALGNLEAAGGYLSELPKRLLALGINDPFAPVWPDAIETLIALDELAPARTYLDHYEVQAQHLQSPWALAAAARCRGLLDAAEGNLSSSLASLEHALVELEGHSYPFERGRALLCLGSVRRQAQQKTAARTALDQALAIFDDLGARLWADKTRAELRRISGRPPASGELTETEHQVATLAAQGQRNKEIAASLHMGVSTVEAHLSRVYRKLGLRRAELAARLLTPQESAANPTEDSAQNDRSGAGSAVSAPLGRRMAMVSASRGSVDVGCVQEGRARDTQPSQWAE